MNLRTIGKRVRLRRAELGWSQKTLAAEAHVAIGTLQAVERAARNQIEPRQTLPENLESIAKALKRSLTDLAKETDGAIPPTDPALVGLNREDLEIARLYHDATTVLRQRARDVLQGTESEHLANVLSRIAQLPAEHQDTVEKTITTLERSLNVRVDSKAIQPRPSTTKKISKQ